MRSSSAFLMVARIALVAPLAACGGTTLLESSDAGTSDASASNDSSSTHDGASPGGACPAEIPTAKTACTTLGLACEYGGTGDHLLCSTIATCQPSANGGNQWYVTTPSSDCVASSSKNPIGCPPSFATLATGAACPREQVSECVYAEGTCGCVSCEADGGTAPGREWACEKWPTPTDCPEPRPRLGSACSTEGLSCAYLAICSVQNDQPYMVCQNGRWAQQPFGADCALRSCGS